MSGKPIWESRFRGLVNSIDSHRQGNQAQLASMTVNVGGDGINTQEYWRQAGKHELLETLEKACRAWEQANWF